MSLGTGSERPLFYISRVAFLMLPGVLLMVASVRAGEESRYLLWLGSAVQVLLFSFFLMTGRIGPGMSHSIIILYLLALGWTWIAGPQAQDWYFHLVQCVLLVVPLLFFAVQTLTDSGALATRRARLLAQRLASRIDWPEELADCRGLAEVKALREAMGADATPALALVQHERPEVRMAALAALEFRKHWKPGQPEVVLRCAQRASDPAIRAAAVAALANIDDRLLVESLAEFLRDRDLEVRRAAIEAILWDSDRRWTWVRHQVRMALADPDLQGDGPLGPESALLKAEAVTDLKPGPLKRAAWALAPRRPLPLITAAR